MKNIVIILFTLLLVVPPVQAHNDVVVFTNVDLHTDMDEAHEEIHHKNDSHDEKEKDHHHHCTVITLTLEFVSVLDYDFSFVPIVKPKEKINFYQHTSYNSYLESIFQPPRF